MACAAGWCDRDCPDRYDYCDDHYQLRDRDDDAPGDMATLDGTRSRFGGQ